MHLNSGVFTTRRRQSPTKSNSLSISSISSEIVSQQIHMNRNSIKKKFEFQDTSWSTTYETVDASTRKVLFLLVLLWSSFLVSSIFQYCIREKQGSKIDGAKIVPSYGSSEFVKRFTNTPQCFAISDDDVSYTLVTHTSEDRLWMMQHHCLRWGQENPISIAIFTNMNTDEVYSKLEAFGCRKTSITVQTMSISSEQEVHVGSDTESDQIISRSQLSSNSNPDYPINKLRNMALSEVKTSHAFIIDIDFFPSLNLFEHLHQNEIRETLALDEKQVLVIPAFQVHRGCSLDEECDQKNILRMPYSKDDLEELIRNREATIFDPTNKGGHGTTDYMTWALQQNRGVIELPCIKSERYEPYILIRFCGAIPPFQESFNGYGKNKLSWIRHVVRLGYKMDQIGEEFIVHFPHKDSTSRKRWNKRPEVLKQYMKVNQLAPDAVNWSEYKRGQIDALYVRFNEWLKSEVKDEIITPLCEKHQKDSNLWVKSTT